MKNWGSCADRVVGNIGPQADLGVTIMGGSVDQAIRHYPSSMYVERILYEHKARPYLNGVSLLLQVAVDVRWEVGATSLRTALRLPTLPWMIKLWIRPGFTMDCMDSCCAWSSLPGLVSLEKVLFGSQTYSFSFPTISSVYL